MKSEQFLILVRHAHRETTLAQLDNGLSEKGLSQVESLKAYFKKRWVDEGLSGFRFLSSPKKRCLETIQPIAETVNQTVDTDPLLLEHGAGERYSDLSNRIENFLKDFFAHGQSVVACTHGDWIPEFARIVEGNAIHLRKSGVMVFKVNSSGGLKLVELITQWKSFENLTKD